MILREVVLETLEANASKQTRKVGRPQATLLDGIPAAMQKIYGQIRHFHKERSPQNWECIWVACNSIKQAMRDARWSFIAGWIWKGQWDRWRLLLCQGGLEQRDGEGLAVSLTELLHWLSASAAAGECLLFPLSSPVRCRNIPDLS